MWQNVARHLLLNVTPLQNPKYEPKRGSLAGVKNQTQGQGYFKPLVNVWKVGTQEKKAANQ